MKKLILSFILSLFVIGACAARQLPPSGIPTVSTPNPLYYIPYAIHKSHATTCVAGNGMTVAGSIEPDYDTLIGVSNPTTSSQTVRFRAYNQSGVLQLWGSDDHKDYSLTAGHSVAMTFIPGNVFADSPIDWTGYATVESTTGGSLSVFSMLGGGGCYPNHWNAFSAELPVIPGSLVARSSSFGGYAIPYYADYNHVGSQSYRTGMALTNFDSVSAIFKVTYTIADFYTGVGTTYTFNKTVAAGNSSEFDLYTELLSVGYPATSNSEGWIRIDAVNSSGANVTVKYGSYILISDRDATIFSAGYGG